MVQKKNNTKCNFIIQGIPKIQLPLQNFITNEVFDKDGCGFQARKYFGGGFKPPNLFLLPYFRFTS